MLDNKDTFNLFDDLSDAEIERFLLDSTESDLDSLEILLEDESPLSGDELMATSPTIATESPKEKFNQSNTEQIKQDEVEQINRDSFTNEEHTPVLTSSTVENEFEQRVAEIEQTMRSFKEQMKAIAQISDSIHEASSKLMADMRKLQKDELGDFSIAYEQAYQLQACLLSTRRAFNEVPNFYDLVEQGWENDLYTAQMSNKS